MKRILFAFLVGMLSIICASAQELKVLELVETADVLSADKQRRDLNGNICAMLDVQLPIQGVVFQGNIVGDTPFIANGYQVYMTPGSKMLEVKCPGHYSTRICFADYGIESLSSKRIYRLKLQPTAQNASPTPVMVSDNYLVMIVEPKDAVVFVDGNMVANSNGTVSVLLPIGSHSYSVSAPGYETEKGSVIITADNNTQHTAILKSNKGTLSIKTLTDGTEIFINGERKGKNSWSGQLPAGRYELQGRKSGYRSWSSFETMAEKEKKECTIPELQPIVGSANVNYMPVGSTILIDGKEQGTTPRVINNLLAGTHQIVIKHEGYTDYTNTFTIKESGKTDITGQLTENISTAKNTEKKVTNSSAYTGYTNGHEWVDLGLPSGLKWATCNVGANSPEEYGDYFAWGETSTKSEYRGSNSQTDGKNNSWLRSNGYIDSDGNLTLSHDAARQNWGGTWRMPTEYEIKELIANTTTDWTTQGGQYGRLVTSKKNGKSIFLPAAGYRDGGSLGRAGEYGYYWSSTPYEGNTLSAYYLYFRSGDFDWYWYYRYYGLSVRAVTE